jgi:hypothetical protein
MYLVAKVPQVEGSCQTGWPRPHNDDTVATPIKAWRKGQRSRYVVDEPCVDVALSGEEAKYAGHLAVTPNSNYSTKTERLKTLL